MRRSGPLAAAVLAALFAAAPAAAAPETVPGEVLVRYKGNAGGSERAQARRSAKVAVKRNMRLRDAQVLRTEPGQTVEQAIAALERHGSVLAAEPNHVFRAAATTPDDTHFGSLWGLHNSAQFSGSLLDADIDAPEAWDVFTAAPAVKVAVVDSGVRWDHPDLDGNIFSNAADPPGGGDDDGNGLVDDTRGWDFHDDDNDPTDLNDHGTHVAGTIAAEGNNGAGVSGVAWDAQIIPVRVLGADGSGSGDAILDGFDYAADMGAKVINASLGGDGNGAMYAGVLAEHPDTLFVVAAGNGGEDGAGDDNEATPQQPCNAPAANLICVAATDTQDRLTSFSNFGAVSVDLAAPGVATYSTVPEFAGAFTDDFETGLAKWTTAGSSGGTWGPFMLGSRKVAGDDPDAGYTFRNGENLVLASAAPVDLTGRSRCVLQYDLRYGYSFQKDGVLVETSTNGTTWTVRAAFTGENGFMEEMKTDPRADGAAALHVRFRVVADHTGEAEDGQPKQWFGATLDDVAVKCSASSPASTYGFMQGTSMATPHVAGVATLLFGVRPDAGVAQVRTWLLGTGDRLDDPLTGLAGRTTTGRRLNAHQALLAASGVLPGPEVVTEPPTAITETGATLTGRVDPNGTATTFQFRYGTTPEALTATAPAVPQPVGSGTALVSVTPQAISGLTPGTTYYVRLVAIQGATETAGVLQSFETGAKRPPILTIGPASNVGSASATVGGKIDPNGKTATVLLEYGKASGVYGSQTSSFAVGEPSELSVELSGLTPGTKYFYRLRASNADGESTSTQGSFTTLASTGVAPPRAPAAPVPVAPSVGPSTQPAPGPPPAAHVSVTCRRTKQGKVTCRAGSTAPLKVVARIFRGRRTYARGSAATLTRGRALKMKTVRRARRGRYKLQLTLIRDGAIVTTLTRTIRL